MSSLSCEDRSVYTLFSDVKTNILIPDYQRPYAWGDDECGTLWDDIINFTIPGGNNKDNFSDNDEYFLGPIVFFYNDDGQQEIIDGQQRLTTLMLLLRAFHVKLGKKEDTSSRKIREQIEYCLWKVKKTDENINTARLKIHSNVATDDEWEDFVRILTTGYADSSMNSQYAKNYRFFQQRIDDYEKEYAGYSADVSERLMDNCFLLQIRAGNQDAALRIFSTLNDRGLPLSDSDIFKAQLYKFYSGIGKKEDFIKRWKNLEEKTKKYFKTSGNPMDELFARYMYFQRAKRGTKLSTTEGLRKFYEKGDYELFQTEETLKNLEDLVSFWEKVATQDEEYFSSNDRVLRNLFVLNYAPNSMWYYFVSVYFLQNRDDKNNLDNERFNQFLDKCIAFIWGFTVVRSVGVNMLRTPIYAEMINIVENEPVTFSSYLFEQSGDQNIRSAFERFEFTNNRPITKAMLAWWAMRNQSQEKIPSLDTKFDIEHIFAKNSSVQLEKDENLEALGNKSLLEPKINHKVTNFEFPKKKPFYKGENRKCPKTVIEDLLDLAKKDDFLEKDIEERTREMISSFIQYIADNRLLK
ncbi:MAG: DUF262 domain-containing protein [Thermoguttaceae bacterium]|nr:DUF262 domain-containing protein [Thermoguttaceae bacterium]